MKTIKTFLNFRIESNRNVTPHNVDVDNDLQDSLDDRQDTSVISAQPSSQIYDEILRRKTGSEITRPEIDSLHGYYYIKKNLLMSEANETRL